MGEVGLSSTESSLQTHCNVSQTPVGFPFKFLHRNVAC